LNGSRPRLVRFNGSWHTREPDGFYRELDEEVIRAGIRAACGWSLKQSEIANILDEVKASTVVDSHGHEIPFWLCDQDMPDPRGLIVMQNGILDPAIGMLWPHTDELFTLNALPFDYDPLAPSPNRWLRFQSEIFDGDQESIGEFQKLCGYLLTQDTRLQKLFAIIGPRRSGKGTLGRVLRALVGESNCCAPSFHTLGGDFGLQPLIGKQLAIIADARTGLRTDKTLVAERLLNISGEDAIDANRKNRTAWSGKLSTRLVVLSNELPALPDPSGALAGRFVAFTTPRSFFGHEDHGLTDDLLRELPAILGWALQGLARLRADGRIVTPRAALGLIDEIETLASPVVGYVRERCSIRPDGMAAKDSLWIDYCNWHRMNGLPGTPLSKAMLGRTLKTAYAGIVGDARPRGDDGARPCYWSGIALLNSTIPLPSGNYGNYNGPAMPFGQGVVNEGSR
jgi:putative DNA primase/helicase